MTVDHGLGGKENAKSKQKRAKRTEKSSKLARKALSASKGEVKFDENSRQEFLTGFRKRKQERRKYGLAMEELKKQKQHNESIKEMRSGGTKDKNVAKDVSDDEVDEAGNILDEPQPETLNTVMYEDPSTVSMFGSAVSVQIDENIVEVNDTFSFLPSLSNESKRQPLQLSRFEKAMKKASVQMNTKKAKRKDTKFSRNKKQEANKLLTKAVGKSAFRKNGGKKGGGKRK